MRGSSFLPHSAFLAACLALAACPADDDAGTSAGDTDATSEGSTSAASSGSDGDPTGADSTTGAPDVSGEEFYLSVCAPCHGPEGEGTALGYALQHPVRDYSTWVVRNGRPMGNPELPGSVMNAYSAETLPDETLEEIWDYLDSFPQPTTGETLYLDYCRNCHGVDALGGITGVNLSAEDKTFAEILETVREGENEGGGGPEQRSLYMPAFSESRLTDAEVQLIADHIDTL